MNQGERSVDVLAFGETMIRFTPSNYERFQQTTQIEAHVGGSESNTAVGLARLGHKVAWFSRLTDNPLGRKISQTIGAHGVDISQVCWTEEDRVGTYYMERGQQPRGSQVYYDRANSAMCRLGPGDFPEDLLQPARVKWLHTTGITFGISDATREIATHIVNRAVQNGVSFSFDVNYRAKLWSPREAAECCGKIAELADLVFIPQRDAITLFQIDDSPAETLNALRQRWPKANIVLTLGASGAAAISNEGQFFLQDAFPAVPVERLGGGDAFSAGYLSGILRQESISGALRWGAAAAAIKYSLSGDLPVFDASMVEKLVQETGRSSLER